MVNKTGSARPRRKRLELDEALIAVFIGAMNANDHVGKIDARERKFLQLLAVNFNIRARVASHVIEAMLVKNHL